jgi:hypothetical protein
MPRRRSLRPEDALARAVLDRHLGIRRGDSVIIETWSHALPWARSFVVEARRRWARPTLIVEDEGAFFRSLELFGSRAVVRTPEPEVTGPAAARVYFGGPEAFPRLLGLPAKDLETLLNLPRSPRRQRGRRARPRGIRLAIGDVTPTAATRYGVDEEAWRAELLRASLVDPAHLELTGRRLVRTIGRARRLRVRHPNGTDLTVGLADRRPSVVTGLQDVVGRATWDRVPSGIIILPLRPGSAEGTWETNRPVYDRFAFPNTVAGGRFGFRGGRLTEFEFDRGGAPFAAAYARGGRGRDLPVALTVGLNPAISHAPEVLELALGTLGLLLGDPPHRAARGRRSGFSFLATLAGADAQADGRPWLLRGLPFPYAPKRSAKASRKVRASAR